MQPPDQRLKLEYLKYLKETIEMDEQTPLTLETPEPQAVADAKTVRCVAIFLGAIAAYCIIGSSLGKFVPDFGEQSKQLISGGIGFLTGLVAPALASAFKK